MMQSMNEKHEFAQLLSITVVIMFQSSFPCQAPSLHWVCCSLAINHCRHASALALLLQAHGDSSFITFTGERIRMVSCLLPLYLSS